MRHGRCPEGYRYSRFCELYRSWASRLSVTMRQAHIGGDKLSVDGACPRAGQRPDPWAGDTVPVIVDRLTGQVRAAQIFVAAMGASNFTDAEASWTQALADWIGAHTRAFAALGPGGPAASGFAGIAGGGAFRPAKRGFRGSQRARYVGRRPRFVRLRSRARR